MNPPEEKLFLHHTIIVDPQQKPYRIDQFLTDKIANATRNKVQQAIKNDFVLVNEKNIKANYKVQPKDIIKVVLPTPPAFDEIQPENIPLEIVYEDESICIINKKAGMVVHPGYNNYSGTLAHALLYHFQNLPHQNKDKIRPGIVHRLDKDTSGLLVIAKTEASMTALSKQFFHHTIQRKYHALVWGIPSNDTDTIQINVGRHPKNRTLMATFKDATLGKHAITHYRILETFTYVSLLECTLETGRTHQIRTHMQAIGHPVFNDGVYGGDKIIKGPLFAKYKSFVQNGFKIIPRQALHAHALGFVHPVTKKEMYFESPWPADFQKIIEKWQKYVPAVID